MDIQPIRYLQPRRGFNAFIMPLVLVVMILLMLFTQEIFRIVTARVILKQKVVENELISDLMLMGCKVLENSLIQYGTGNISGSGSAREIIASNPKLYFDLNGDGILDALIVYTLTYLSSTKIEFVLTAYRLARSECGKTNQTLLTMEMEPLSPKKVKILSNSFSTNMQMSLFLQYSLKDVNLVKVINKLSLIKKLNLVAND